MNPRFLIQSLYSKTGINYANNIYKIFIRPRSHNEDIKRYEFILNTILCIVIPILILLDGIIAFYVKEQGINYHGISFVKFSGIIFIFSCLLLLSRKGFYRTVAYIFLSIFYVLTSYGAIHWGVELPMVAISYIVIIVISSILISTRFAVFVTIFISLTINAITYLQLANIIHPILQWKYSSISISDPIQLSFFFFLIAGLSWLSNREMERSLYRARASEAALIEERNLLEIKVEERTKELKEIQKEKVSQLYRFAEFGKLSSGVFHDLMNTLNVVVLNVSQLEKSSDHVSEVKEYVEKAVTASKRMGNYIQSIRKQITNNDLDSIFAFEKEIEDALDILHFRAREASVTITHKIKDPISIQGNALKFYQVILNLLVNSIDACEENDRESFIEITQLYSLDKTHAVLIIKDNGCGISQDNIKTIFNPLFTTKSYTKGTGMGLSQTKEIVENIFSGNITVTSTMNMGTTFIIKFPII